MGKNFDREMAKRVWERVQTAQPEIPVLPVKHTDELRNLILEEWQTAEVYAQLSRQLQDKYRTTVKQLYDQKKAQIACLKGIYKLEAGEAATVHAVAPKPESMLMQLRKCYGRQMRCMARYEARGADPDYGPVYSRLAAQNRSHCHSLLEILGSLKK